MECNRRCCSEWLYSLIENVIDIKLSKFGFKVLHKILACAANLTKWTIIENVECQMCSVRDDRTSFDRLFNSQIYIANCISYLTIKLHDG